MCSRPPCVYAAARMPIHFRHELPALAQVQVARGSAGAKKSRQNQEWPKNGVFRCACRAHTLALSMIRAHMAQRGVLALCLQAPGETAAAMHFLCRPRFCPRCHLRPHPTSALTRVGLPARAALQPLAGIWLPPRRGTECGSIVCTRCAPAHKVERSRASKRRKGKVAFRRVFVCTFSSRSVVCSHVLV